MLKNLQMPPDRALAIVYVTIALMHPWAIETYR